jgi:hypothetical protein
MTTTPIQTPASTYSVSSAAATTSAAVSELNALKKKSPKVPSHKVSTSSKAKDSSIQKVREPVQLAGLPPRNSAESLLSSVGIFID